MIDREPRDAGNDVDSVHSSLSEEVHPLEEFQRERPRSASRSSQGTSVFAALNGDRAFPDIEADQNPLSIMTTAHLERELMDASESDEREQTQVLPSKQSWKKRLLFILRRLKPDFFLLHHDRQSLKVVSRTWVQIFVSLVLFVIPAVDRYVGTAAFLVVLFGVIEVSGGVSVAHAFYTGIVDMVFVLTAFAFTAIGGAINWSIRNYPSLEGLMQELAAEGTCSLGDQACFMHQVHKGRYLSTKTSVMMLIMMAASWMLCGFMQTWNRALTVSWIISAICTTITGAFILMTPNYDPWLYGSAVAKPVGISLCVRMVMAMLYFPVTSNYKFFSTVIKALSAAKGILANDVMGLKGMTPSDPEFAKKTEALSDKINKSLGIFALLKLESLFVRGEFSYSILDPGNLGEFRSDARALLNSLAGVRFFFGQIVEKHSIISELIVREGLEGKKSSESNDGSPESENKGTDTIAGANSTNPSSVPREVDGSITETFIGDGQRTPGSSDQTESGTGNQNVWDYREISSGTPGFLNPSRRPTFSEPSKPLKKNKWLHKKLRKTYARVGNFEEQRLFLAEKIHRDNMRHEDLETLYSAIISHYEPVSEANIALLSEVIAWAGTVNSTRLWTLLSPSAKKKHSANRKMHNERISSAVAALRGLLQHRNDQDSADWVHRYSNPKNLRSRQHYIYLLSMDAFYCEMLETLSRNTLRLASYCLLLDDYRPAACFIHPFMASMSLSPRVESEYNHGVSEWEGAADVNMSYQAMASVQARNPDASPPRTLVHLIGLQIEKLWHIMTDGRVVFCFKRALLGIASVLLFTSRSTVYFAYSQRIVWVTIMVVLTVSYQAVDGVYGFLVKLIATFVGSLLGMLIWYIGDGHGAGNSYGFAAAATFILLPLVWYRHYHTLAIPMGAIIACVSTVLVAGTSWVSATGLMPDTDVHWGFSVAWRRFATVVVGITVAFIGTILPHPVTAKKQLRQLLGQCLEDLGGVQSGVTAFMVQRGNDAHVRIIPRLDLISKKLRGTKVRMATVQQLMRLIKYEPPLGGFWPRNRMELLVKLERELIFLADTIYHLIDAIGDTSLVPALRQRLGWGSIELTSGIFSVYAMASSALITGNPLPSVTTGHLSEQYSRYIRSFLRHDAAHTEKGLEGLLEDQYISRDGRITLALITAVGAYYKRLDFCIHLIKGLVGEKFPIDQSSLQTDDEIEPLVWPKYAKE